MPSMTAKQMHQGGSRQMSQAVRGGEVVELTWHGKPYAYVVPADQWHEMTNTDADDEQRGAA